MKVYVTKYALSAGIKIVEAELANSCENAVVTTDRFVSMYFGKNWHLTAASAEARAEEMRLAKIASIKKQLAKLETMKITAPKEA